MAALVDAVKGWVHQPFKETMDLWGWIAFVLMLWAILFLWSRVLSHIGE
jgi:hypothetical protein